MGLCCSVLVNLVSHHWVPNRGQKWICQLWNCSFFLAFSKTEMAKKYFTVWCFWTPLFTRGWIRYITLFFEKFSKLFIAQRVSGPSAKNVERFFSEAFLVLQRCMHSNIWPKSGGEDTDFTNLSTFHGGKITLLKNPNSTSMREKSADKNKKFHEFFYLQTFFIYYLWPKC